MLRADVGCFEKDILYRAGEQCARDFCAHTVNSKKQDDPVKALEAFAAECRFLGIGEFRITRAELDKRIIEISATDTIESMGVSSCEEVEEEASCSFSSGFLALLCKEAFQDYSEGADEITVVEIECRSHMGAECRFLAGPTRVIEAMGLKTGRIKESISEHALKLNEEILLKNLELQNLNLDLERMVRKRTEELWKSQENYRTLTELSPDPIVICRMNGDIISINEAGMKLIRHTSKSDIINSKAYSLLSTGQTGWENFVWTLEKEGEVKNLDAEILTKDGSKIIGEASAKFVEMGSERCIQAVIRDVTEKKFLEKQMIEAQRELEFLNDLLSHDIVNYMTASLYFINNLKNSPHLTDDDRRSLDYLSKDVRGAYELAMVVRDTYRARSMGESDCEVKDLLSSIEEAVEDVKRLYSERKMTISIDGPAERPYVIGNVLLPKLFLNLLSNSVKYDSSPEVSVRVQIDLVAENGSEYWRTKVIDHGRGIPDEDKEKVFRRYYRGDMSVPGAGLGLVLVRHLADSCKGRVWAENTIEGDHNGGTTMVVMLPRANHRGTNKAWRAARA